MHASGWRPGKGRCSPFQIVSFLSVGKSLVMFCYFILPNNYLQCKIERTMWWPQLSSELVWCKQKAHKDKSLLSAQNVIDKRMGLTHRRWISGTVAFSSGARLDFVTTRLCCAGERSKAFLAPKMILENEIFEKFASPIVRRCRGRLPIMRKTELVLLPRSM